MSEHLTKETFLEKVFDYENSSEWSYRGELPAVIDFYADWCGPCKMVAPIIEELSREYEGKVSFYKVDTEAEQELAAAFGIQSIPSLLFIPKDGKPQMAAGALPKQTLQQVIDKELLGAENIEVH
jgi:thioredoxin